MDANTPEFGVHYQGRWLEAQEGETVKKVLLRNGYTPHEEGSQYLHCPSLGTCGTCAMKMEGDLSEKTKIEHLRLHFPPHGCDPD